MSTRTTFGRHPEPSMIVEKSRVHIRDRQVYLQLMGKFDGKNSGMPSPGLSRLKKLRMVMGMLYFIAGIVVLGWSTLAPK